MFELKSFSLLTAPKLGGQTWGSQSQKMVQWFTGLLSFTFDGPVSAAIHPNSEPGFLRVYCVFGVFAIVPRAALRAEMMLI